MRKIVVSISAAALALSMLAQAIPAAAVTGYDSAYAGESAFVNIAPGQSNEFQVFFANTGTTAWGKGTATQVDLAACLDDKVTCNAQDATEATWNSSWLSATRYATTTQTLVAPGSIATFKYTVMAPAGVAAGTYRFNGDLVLSSTGERIHPEGYYQDATVGAGSGAPTLTSLTPVQGPAGTNVTISGTGFVCQPTFPTATFDTVAATTTSCGASTITVQAPAHALGSVTVTVSNQGSAASNGLTFTYIDTTPPTYTSMSVSGNIVNVTFDEPVCGTYDATSWQIKNVSTNVDFAPGSVSNEPTDCTKAVSTFQIFLTSSLPTGAFVEATLLQDGTTGSQNSVQDPSGNFATAPISRQATAVAPETVKPTLVSASGVPGQMNITLTFSEPVYCNPAVVPADFTVDDQSTTSDPTVTAAGTGCGTTQQAAATTFDISISAALKANTSYVVTIGASAAGKIKDTSNNTLSVPTSVTFTSGAGDSTPPTMTDARMLNNAGPSTDFVEAGDSFTVTFSEKMNASTTGTVSIQDQDGTTATIQCSAVTGANQATCTWDTATKTVMTVVLTGTLANTQGTTPGMQIPFNITALTGITDVSGNPPNVLGSPDRLVDYE